MFPKRAGQCICRTMASQGAHPGMAPALTFSSQKKKEPRNSSFLMRKRMNWRCSGPSGPLWPGPPLTSAAPGCPGLELGTDHMVTERSCTPPPFFSQGESLPYPFLLTQLLPASSAPSAETAPLGHTSLPLPPEDPLNSKAPPGLGPILATCFFCSLIFSFFSTCSGPLLSRLQDT